MQLPGRREDLRLVAPALTAWVTAALLLGAPPAAAVAVGVTAGLAGCLVWHRRTMRPARRNVTAACLACAAAAALAVGPRLAAVGAGPLAPLAADRSRTTVEAVLTADPQPRGTGRRVVTVPARAELVRTPHGWVRARTPILLIATGAEASHWARLLPSQRLRVTGDLAPPRFGQSIAAVVFTRGPPEPIGAPTGLQRLAGHVRSGLRAAVEPLPPAERGILPALVVGDTSLLDPGLEEVFRTTGLAHLLVVSGANVAIVLGAVLAVARWAGFGVRTAPLLAGLAVLGFALLARPEPSVLRATVMGLVTVVALATGRERRSLPALAAAVLGLVLVDPTLARSYGFALSVLATAGLLVFAPAWSDRMACRVPRWVAESLAVPAAAQIACAPLLVTLSGQVSVVAVFANLLAAPAVAPATILGLLAAVTAPLSLDVARACAHVGGVAVRWIVTVAHVSASVPFAALDWPGGVAGAFALAGVAVLAALVLRYRTGRLVAAAVLLGVIAAGAGLPAVAPGWPPRGWMLVACDVGQGDALVLAAGPGAAVVVDAGPEPGRIDRCLRDLEVRRVPLLVLTHLHLDHVGGVAGVTRNRQVGTVLAGGVGPASAEWAQAATGVERDLGAVDVEVRRAGAGQRWRVGAVRLTVLWPAGTGTHATGGEQGWDREAAENNASVVLLAERKGASVLLSGDVESETQSVLAATAHVRADVLKVPHHGSANFAPRFFEAVDARLAVISAGEDNPYGHPSPRTLRSLRASGARPLRTDRDGDIAVVLTENGLAAVPAGG